MNDIRTVDDYLALKPVKPTNHIAYGEHDQQFGELYLPQSVSEQEQQKLYPIIILLHGGCWRAAYDSSVLGGLSQSLCQLGYAVWNLEYRRLGNGGGWPVTFQDVALGTDFLRSIADKYYLDLHRVITMGHSAGGHLALWLASRNKLATDSVVYQPKPLAIQSVISLAGIPDLDQASKRSICRGAVDELMGGSPDAIAKKYKQGSPHHLEPFDISTYHLVGEFDPIVPFPYLAQYLEENPSPHKQLDIIPDIGHFEMVMPDTIAWDYILRALQRSHQALLQSYSK